MVARRLLTKRLSTGFFPQPASTVVTLKPSQLSVFFVCIFNFGIKLRRIAKNKKNSNIAKKVAGGVGRKVGVSTYMLPFTCFIGGRYLGIGHKKKE